VRIPLTWTRFGKGIPLPLKEKLREKLRDFPKPETLCYLIYTVWYQQKYFLSFFLLLPVWLFGSFCITVFSFVAGMAVILVPVAVFLRRQSEESTLPCI
jgi:hypothetical protein